MVKVALLVRLQAKPGREADVESFLEKGLALADRDPPPSLVRSTLGPVDFRYF